MSIVSILELFFNWSQPALLINQTDKYFHALFSIILASCANGNNLATVFRINKDGDPDSEPLPKILLLITFHFRWTPYGHLIWTLTVSRRRMPKVEIHFYINSVSNGLKSSERSVPFEVKDPRLVQIYLIRLNLCQPS